jgi:hypothetical protein
MSHGERNIDEVSLIKALGDAQPGLEGEGRTRASAKLLAELERGQPPRTSSVRIRLAWIGAALLLAVPGGIAVAEQLRSEDESLPPWVDPGPPSPVLTEEQEAQGLEIAAQDPLLQEVLEGKQYAVRVGPWGGHGVGGSVEPIQGVGLIYELDQPAAFGMRDWPIVEYAPDADPPYRETTIRMGVENATVIYVSVDLESQRVVELEPSGDEMRVTPSQELRDQAKLVGPNSGD